MKRIKYGIICTLIFLLAGFCCSGSVLASERRTVRVGYFQFDGFNDYTEEGDMCGYGYDYLQKLKKYTNWDYEFVTKKPVPDKEGRPTKETAPVTYEDCIDMLKKGEIDLLGTVRKTEEREKVFGFPQLSSGKNYGILAVLDSETDYEYGDLEAIRTMRIGVLKGSSRNQEFIDYLSENNITGYRLVEYGDINQMEDALHKSKEVDAILTSSLRAVSNEKILLRYAPSEYYFVTRKSDQDLLRQLNDAQEKLDIYETDMKEELRKKYYTDRFSNNAGLTREEKKYISRHPDIRVAVRNKWEPFAYYDKKDDKYKGIWINILDEISKQCGLKFKYMPVDSYEDAMRLQETGKTDIMVGFPCEYAWASKKNLRITSKIMDMQTGFVTGSQYVDVKRKDSIAAVVKGDLFTESYIKHQGNVIYYCKDMRECMDAVKKGTADMAFVELYAAEWYLKNPKYISMGCLSAMDGSYGAGIALSESCDDTLYTIMDKVANSFTENQIIQFIYMNQIEENGSESLTEWLYRSPGTLVGICVVIFCIAIILITLVINSVNKQKQNQLLAAKNLELEKLMERERKANRAKSDFLAKMSHDIRTPLNAIIGMNHVAGLHTEDEKRIRECLRKVDSSAQYLLAMLNDILNMSKIENGTCRLSKVTFRMKNLLDDIRETIGTQAEEKGVKLEIEDNGLGKNYYSGDEIRLKQIFINLLSNGIKFTEMGGKVSMRVKMISETERDATLHISVKDNGIGISEEFKKRLFKPFEQENLQNFQESAGTGLGLSIVWNLLELMHGRIDVETKKGEGTEFIIVITLEKALPAARENEMKHGQDCYAGQRVLVVEDNDLNAEIAKSILETYQLTVETAENGKEAVEMFKQSDEDYYKMILMDIRMPVMDGYEATACIRNLSRADAGAIPIVAISANAFEDDIQKSLDSGMNGHMQKPIDIKALEKILKEYIK